MPLDPQFNRSTRKPRSRSGAPEARTSRVKSLPLLQNDDALGAIAARHPLLTAEQERQLGRELQTGYQALIELLLETPLTYGVLTRSFTHHRRLADFGSGRRDELTVLWQKFRRGEITESQYTERLQSDGGSLAQSFKKLLRPAKSYTDRSFWTNHLNKLAALSLSELKGLSDTLDQFARSRSLDRAEAVRWLKSAQERVPNDLQSSEQVLCLKAWEERNLTTLDSALSAKTLLEQAIGRINRPRNELICSNVGLVMAVCRQRRHRVSAPHSGRVKLAPAEFYPAGLEGLLRAIDGFDPDRGCRFSTYAINWIRQTVEREHHKLGATIRTPVKLVVLAEKLSHLQQRLLLQGYAADDSEIARELGVSVPKLRLIRKAALANAPVFRQVDRDNGNGLAPWDLKSQPENSEHDNVEQAARVQRVCILLPHLFDQRDAVIIAAIFNLPAIQYYDQVSDFRSGIISKHLSNGPATAFNGRVDVVSEVRLATEMRLSRERIRQIKQEAIEIFRNYFLVANTPTKEILRLTRSTNIEAAQVVLLQNALLEKPLSLAALKATGKLPSPIKPSRSEDELKVARKLLLDAINKLAIKLRETKQI